MRLTGFQRLGVVLSLIWLMFCCLLALVGEFTYLDATLFSDLIPPGTGFNLRLFSVFTGVPIALYWGLHAAIAWIIAGFKSQHSV